MAYQRKLLSAKGLNDTVRECFAEIEFPKLQKGAISWVDCLMSGLAIFGLKFSSLLKFDKGKKTKLVKKNLENLYGVLNAPSDTYLRERLDNITPEKLRKPFKKIFANLQRGKVLEGYTSVDGYYIVAVDATGQYSSSKVKCKNCCTKKHNNGDTTYHHQMLAAALVHPDQKAVIPFAPEPIVKGDGFTKNDCEQNAAKRMLPDMRREHPHLKILIVQDALYATKPHLSLLEQLNMRYIITFKPRPSIETALEGHTPQIYHQQKKGGKTYTFHVYHDVPLNQQHPDYLVNVLRCCEKLPDGTEHFFDWITNCTITQDNVHELMRAGRARWRIENETFNTLKNQGYNFEHNYGHGEQYLCSVFTILMMLTFLIDQVKELCDKAYQEARAHHGSLKSLFEYQRVAMYTGIWKDWDSFHEGAIPPQARAG